MVEAHDRDRPGRFRHFHGHAGVACEERQLIGARRIQAIHLTVQQCCDLRGGIADRLPALLERHRQSIEIMRGRAECKDGVIFFDVTDHDLEGYNKFVPYYLHPEGVYSVGLSKSSFRTKVSVGSNPWTTATYMENLAKICERYGGGGHARVGAISFQPNQFDVARKAAEEIVAELRASYRKHGG